VRLLGQHPLATSLSKPLAGSAKGAARFECEATRVFFEMCIRIQKDSLRLKRENPAFEVPKK
jgi:hypothetical protein